MFADVAVISTYTRAEALADGELVDVSTMAKEAGFRIPVAVSRSLWATINPTEELKAFGQDADGRLWDVLWMARHAIRRSNQSHRINYTVIFAEMGRTTGRPKQVTKTLRMVSGPGDHGEHVLTIMFPEDD